MESEAVFTREHPQGAVAADRADQQVRRLERALGLSQGHLADKIVEHASDVLRKLAD